MKKAFLFVLAAITLFGCQKDQFAESESGGITGPASVKIKINIDPQSITRAVEDSHTGENGTNVMPKVYSVTLYTYNTYGTLKQVELKDAEMKAAITSSYIDANGTEISSGTGSGATIGLPDGTKYVDVVINNPEGSYTDISENINYYNRRDNDATLTASGAKGANNFDRVFLVTENYAKNTGVEIARSGYTPDEDGIPVYDLAQFTVKPALARFEVFGAINVAAQTAFKDANGLTWRMIDKNNVSEETMTAISVGGVGGGYNYGIVVGAEKDGFNPDMLYIPSKYDEEGTPTDNPYYKLKANGGSLELAQGADATALQDVLWCPNAFHAVDVEEVYINNIYVRGNTSQYKPYSHPWPGSEVNMGWPDWYKSYHLEGWHTKGTSADNTFLCMGNMWDRIADAEANGYTDVNWNGLTIPGITSAGNLPMKVITGKAKPVSEVSDYIDKTNTPNRNLGLVAKKGTKDRAAAYMFYGQAASNASASKEVLGGELPHIILKVKCYKTPEDYATGKYVENKQFITVKLFASDATNGSAYVTTYERGKIYSLNLNDLLGSFVGNSPVPEVKHPDGKDPKDPVDPDPEMPGVKAIIKIGIQPWTIQNVHPVI